MSSLYTQNTLYKPNPLYPNTNEAKAQRAEKVAKAEAARQALGPKGTLKP